jgi:alpha-tubulin suppressor-like RCC1 family protein
MKVMDVQHGLDFTIVKTDDGKLWSWGNNKFG